MNHSDSHHPNDDTLLHYILGTLEVDMTQGVQDHLHSCPDCQSRLAAIRDDVALLRTAALPPRVPEIPLPGDSFPISRTVIRAAAILVIGFSFGFLSATLFQDHPTAWLIAAAESPAPKLSAQAHEICGGESLTIFLR